MKKVGMMNWKMSDDLKNFSGRRGKRSSSSQMIVIMISDSRIFKEIMQVLPREIPTREAELSTIKPAEPDRQS